MSELWTEGLLWFRRRPVTPEMRANDPEWFDAIEVALSRQLVEVVRDTNRMLVTWTAMGTSRSSSTVTPRRKN